MDRKDLLMSTPYVFLFIAILVYALVSHMDLITIGLMLLVMVLACFTALFMIVVVAYAIDVYGKRKASALGQSHISSCDPNISQRK